MFAMNPAKALAWLLRFGTGGAFVVAGALKLQDPGAFAEQIANYQLIPELANYLAVLLPPLEILAAIALVFSRGSLRWAAAVMLGGLLFVFTAALARAWALGINLECGCFGTGSTEIGPWPILRNVTILTALGFALWLERRPSELPTNSGELSIGR